VNDWELARVVAISANKHDQHVRLVTVLVKPKGKDPGSSDLEEVEVALSNVSLLEAVNYV
jgi:hypothetical protein